jgi:hypothetical protein
LKKFKFPTNNTPKKLFFHVGIPPTHKNIIFPSIQTPHAPVGAMMFDFQTLRYASPMIDLATFLANSTGTDIRSSHFSFIFKTYHEEVIKTLMFTLKKFRHEIPEIYRLA